MMVAFDNGTSGLLHSELSTTRYMKCLLVHRVNSSEELCEF